ncbi:unnamed protein product [Paramecium sonneborni]|uniref:Transmembrane protein n=1 Tax=Paramecium sonneborni TaxID=65129 RepID=A0A8S1RMF3_9CILI|nr:unnamed protein product [Paramecium sonneborni]
MTSFEMQEQYPIQDSLSMSIEQRSRSRTLNKTAKWKLEQFHEKNVMQEEQDKIQRVFKIYNDNLIDEHNQNDNHFFEEYLSWLPVIHPKRVWPWKIFVAITTLFVFFELPIYVMYGSEFWKKIIGRYALFYGIFIILLTASYYKLLLLFQIILFQVSKELVQQMLENILKFMQLLELIFWKHQKKFPEDFEIDCQIEINYYSLKNTIQQNSNVIHVIQLIIMLIYDICPKTHSLPLVQELIEESTVLDLKQDRIKIQRFDRKQWAKRANAKLQLKVQTIIN